MSAIILINVLLAVPFIALWVGIPLWLVTKRSDPKPQVVAPAVVQTLPEPRVHAAYQRAA